MKFMRVMTVAAAVLVSALTAPAFAGVMCQHTDEELNDMAARDEASQRVAWASQKFPPGSSQAVRVQLLGFNDFHGQLSPRRVSNRPAGGAAVLASYLQAETNEFNGTTFIVHAGDHVGASPPNSALLQDEPSISFVNMLGNEACRREWSVPGGRTAHVDPNCNIVGTFGNHEFDEGIDEALRLIEGGDHPKGPFLEPHWNGAFFPLVSANFVWKDTQAPVLPPFVVKYADGVPVGFIGSVLKETPTIVTPTGVAGLSFLDEADAINRYVAQLKRQGVRAIVVTIHQGGTQSGSTIRGAIVDIVKRLDPEVDVVVAGHTHSFNNGFLPNSAGQPVLIAQAFSSSTAYDDIELTLDRATGDVVEKASSVKTTWGDQGPGLTPDPQVAEMVRQADELVAPLVNRVVGESAIALTRTENAAGESTLGNLIADAQRAAMKTQFAFMNPGGIRSDLDQGTVTWGELFNIQPFGNSLVKLELTGDQIYRLLEQQWANQPFPRIMKTSGFTYTWNPSAPVGSRIVEVRIDGSPIDRAATFTVTCNNFMATGGDNYTVFTEGKNQVGGPIDLDALIEYVTALPQPFSAAIEGRILTGGN
jgi:5'-nucleotidase